MKFLGTTLFIEHVWWMLLKIASTLNLLHNIHTFIIMAEFTANTFEMRDSWKKYKFSEAIKKRIFPELFPISNTDEKEYESRCNTKRVIKRQRPLEWRFGQKLRNCSLWHSTASCNIIKHAFMQWYPKQTWEAHSCSRIRETFWRIDIYQGFTFANFI